MKRFIASLTILVAACTSIATHGFSNRHDPDVSFSKIESDYALNDSNSYGCEKTGVAVLQHILQNGSWVTGKDVHDYYSTTGCTIRGSVEINGSKKEFTYDYGGILYFDDGRILGCGQDCCREDYPNCSYDKENLRGF